jgi:membrane associated rhomboid family serine protease
MFVPIGDSPNFRSTPWVTYTLIAINMALFILLWPSSFRTADPRDPAAAAYRQVIAAERGVAVSQVSAYDAVVFRHGFKPGAPRALDMFTSMFLHGGWMHLLGNMLFLWIYGDNVEHRLGRLGYLAAYLGTGVAAAWGDALLRPDSLIPAVGASGAISGVLGFYFIWFPKNRVRVWVFLFPLIMDVIELPARVVLGIYLVLDNILPALLSGGEGGVAYGAHLGGFAAAVAAALVMDRFRLQRPEAEVRGPRVGPPPRGASAAMAFRARLDAGDLTGALTTLMAMRPAECARDLEPEEILSLGRTLEAEHHPRAALTVYQRLLGEHPHRPTRAAARVGAARVLINELRMPAEAYQQLVLALEMDPPTEVATEARALILRIRQFAGSVPRQWQ